MKITDLPEMRNRTDVFRDRRDAGTVLAGMMEKYKHIPAQVMAIPAGGVEVGVMLAETLKLPLDIAVVSKITPPWSTELGYGAVAFDDSVLLNRSFLHQWGLSEEEVQEGIARAKEKVRRRITQWRGVRLFPDLAGKTVLLVDDGLATGYTMQGAINALVKYRPKAIVVAVPTAHTNSIEELKGMAETFFCPNIRSGLDFAVADAYRHWSDVRESEVGDLLNRFWEQGEKPGSRI
jgi:putative phosphoribosyl transferase